MIYKRNGEEREGKQDERKKERQREGVYSMYIYIYML